MAAAGFVQTPQDNINKSNIAGTFPGTMSRENSLASFPDPEYEWRDDSEYKWPDPSSLQPQSNNVLETSPRNNPDPTFLHGQSSTLLSAVPQIPYFGVIPQIAPQVYTPTHLSAVPQTAPQCYMYGVSMTYPAIPQTAPQGYMYDGYTSAGMTDPAVQSWQSSSSLDMHDESKPMPNQWTSPDQQMLNQRPNQWHKDHNHWHKELDEMVDAPAVAAAAAAKAKAKAKTKAEAKTKKEAKATAKPITKAKAQAEVEAILKDLRDAVCAARSTDAAAKFVEMAFKDTESSEAAQEAFEMATGGEQELLANAFHGRVLEAMKHKHANYVIPKLVKVLPSDQSAFIAEELTKYGFFLAQHKQGVRIICEYVQHDHPTETVLKFLGEVLENLRELCSRLNAKNKYGQVVVRHLLEFGTDEHKHTVAVILGEQLWQHASGHESSRVVEAALEHCSSHDQDDLAEELLGQPFELLKLAHDRWGYHVVLAMLRGKFGLRTINALLALDDVHELKESEWGKHVYAEMFPKPGVTRSQCRETSTMKTSTMKVQ